MMISYQTKTLEFYPESPDDIEDLMKKIRKALNDGLTNDEIIIHVYRDWVEKPENKEAEDGNERVTEP